MKVCIENCNNIKSAEILITDNELNIKYGVNGCGKTTLTQSIRLQVDKQKLEPLRPYGFTGKQEVSLDSVPSKIKIFDEDFISNMVFIEDNVANNIFEVFIKPKDYEAKINKISEILKSLKSVVSSEILTSFVAKVDDLENKLRINRDTKKIPATSPVFQALKEGNKTHDDLITEEVEVFRSLIKDEKRSAEWLDWQSKGAVFNDNIFCPYCGADLPADFSKILVQISAIFDKKNIKNRIIAKKLFEEIYRYLTVSSKKNIEDILESKDNLDDKQVLNLFEILSELYLLRDKIKDIVSIDPHILFETAKPHEELLKLKVDVPKLIYISSKELLDKLNEITEESEKFSKVATDIDKAVGVLNSAIRKSSFDSKKQINNFLKTAGIEYAVEIENEDQKNAKMVLKPLNETFPIKPNDHLSFGERNAFALILFMFYALAENSELIILDDPVSSFDENKKYAIVHELFNNKSNNLYGKTVLMLTHDFNPVIDFVKNNKPTGAKNNAFYLSNSDGVISERVIKWDDIKPVIKVARDNAQDLGKNMIYRVIHLRRLLEMDEINSEAYNMLSSLLKGRAQPTVDQEGITPMNKAEIALAREQIEEHILGFDYDSVIREISDNALLKTYYDASTSNFEKLQLTRIFMEIHGIPDDEDVLGRFIKESYHIENNLLFQLDPYAYDMVPEYIIKTCDRKLNVATGAV